MPTDKLYLSSPITNNYVDSDRFMYGEDNLYKLQDVLSNQFDSWSVKPINSTSINSTSFSKKYESSTNSNSIDTVVVDSLGNFLF